MQLHLPSEVGQCRFDAFPKAVISTPKSDERFRNQQFLSEQNDRYESYVNYLSWKTVDFTEQNIKTEVKMFDIWEGIFCDFDSPHIYKVYKKFLFFRYREKNWKI